MISDSMNDFITILNLIMFDLSKSTSRVVSQTHAWFWLVLEFSGFDQKFGYMMTYTAERFESYTEHTFCEKSSQSTVFVKWPLGESGKNPDQYRIANS